MNFESWYFLVPPSMHHLTKIITDGMSALLYVLCVQFIIFAVMSMSACKPNQAIYKMLWCPNPPPMYVYLDWPYIMAFRMRTQERLRAMSLSLFTIAILTWVIKTCLLNPKLILQISVFGRRNPHYKRRFSAAACFPFPAAHRSPVFCSSAHGRLWQ